MFSNKENQNLEWVKKDKARNERPNTFQNESINSSRLAFIAGDELKKLVDNKTNYATIFTPGPDIEKLIDAFEHGRGGGGVKSHPLFKVGGI